MKRSEINSAIEKSKKILEQIQFYLPDFSRWNFYEWKNRYNEADEIIATGMGWDVTDFGSNDFHNIGAVIFTLRNGSLYENIGVPYAEKVIVMQERQKIPLHFHFQKVEDIINRGNGILCVRLYNSNKDMTLNEITEPKIKLDGIWNIFEPGETFEIFPGNSCTLTPNLYHEFWAKEGNGTLVCGEVSTINDDNKDNHFYNPSLRYAKIIEDEEMKYILCNEYKGKLT